MFKFLRQYEKHILAVGVTVLMIAFLIQPTISMFQPDPVKQPIGSVGDTQWTIRDKRQARGELSVLERLGVPLAHLAAREDAALQWMLIHYDAQSLGLWAGDAEVNQLLLMLGRDEARIAQIADDMGTTRDFVRNTARKWLITQQYIELVNGLAHLPTAGDPDSPSRLGHYEAAQAYQKIGHDVGFALELAAAKGTPRLSPPVVQRFLHDQQTTAKVTALAIRSDRYLSKVPEPTAERLGELFNNYRDSLPGNSKPYGFGYRKPDRVKIDYLSIPFQRVADTVEVDEADALDYYDNNPNDFLAEPAQPEDTTSPADFSLDGRPNNRAVLPYTQVRGQIIADLKMRKAKDLATKIVKAAQAILLDDLRTRGRGDAESGGADPVTFAEVAEKLQQRFGILADTHHRDDRWLNRIDLAALPAIGSSALLSPRQMRFIDYALAVRPLVTKDSPAAMASVAFDVGAPSLPVQSFDGSQHLFRITAAEPAQSPTSIDEVRQAVVADAKRLSAYGLLRDEAHIWEARAKEEGLLNLATELGVQLVSPPAFAKRQLFQAGDLAVPLIEGVGRDAGFIEIVFKLVDNLVAVQDLSLVGEPLRLIAVTIDRQQALYLTRLDDASPMTEKLFKEQSTRPEVAAIINQALLIETPNPLSVSALAERVGFTFAESEEENSDPDDTESKEEPQA